MLEVLFVATARAVPAAAGYDWKWMVPVATLILGFGLKWLQDHVTEKGRRHHDRVLRREQRFDLLRSRRIDAERANLLALQPLVLQLMRAAVVGYMEDLRSYQDQGRRHWGRSRLSAEADFVGRMPTLYRFVREFIRQRFRAGSTPWWAC